ncbi:diacylglycerol/lipid kinase family protein [Aureibacter tunicatorum]|uniref:YegS/Rv2252/BmrU family lipid kinase n=1 Tax=Aureibacter tunicatorum TaxID=866807 RepID=A0AAE3XK29_9BACT|nr:diacylglycerol kinase family protein [Aureibacter tunicatorum]MDR6238352.1 YegS/Rv2252/BmrU family lipid kinase [Aureibacter tunicatorum]BDD03384.1 hypothetical protein AUTU_08670 [Aureibacter tunicatorum]
MQGNSDNLLFVVNPIAGGQDKEPFYKALSKIVQRHKFNYSMFHTTGEDQDEVEILQLLDTGQFAKIVAVGGDGTVRMIANLIKGRKESMGIVPFGSANGLATELMISTDPLQALEVIVSKGVVKAVDLLMINEKHYCLHLSDVGINAQLIKRFEEDSKRGFLAYAKQFFKTLPSSKKIRYSIIADGVEFKGSAFMIVFANAQKYGTGAIVNPHGKLDDGKFEICILKTLTAMTLLRSFASIFIPDKVDMSDMKFIQCAEAEVTFRKNKPQTFQIDGELMEETTSLTMKSLKNILNLIVPDDAQMLESSFV